MSDIIDKANDQADLIRAIEASARAQEGPRPTGLCLNCGEPLTPGGRRCDIDCRDDWERRQR